MKRNLDLIRTILREIEKKPDGSTYLKVSPPEGVEMSAFMAHLELLIDAGFIKGKVGEYALRNYEINRLTWQGHEFLDATRDETLWSKAKKKVAGEAMSWTTSLLLEYLKQEVRKRLGLPIP
jgi:hypothetical protein